MPITSWHFVAFVIATLLVYYILPHRLQNVWLLAASCFFYVTFAWQFAVTLAIFTLVMFWIARSLHRSVHRRAIWLWAGIALSVAALAFFKYNDFYMPAVLGLLKQSGIAIAPSDTLTILLPVGLSYIVLQVISYLVDIYRKQTEPAASLVDFALCLAYFPKLTAGPIERPRTFLPILATHRTVDNQTLGIGFTQIAEGVFRKIVIANTLLQMMPDALFQSPQSVRGGLVALLVWLLAYAFYLYNDFAGYTSIVRGLSKLFGIELSANFAQPYFARNFAEFWNRWHITLSHWLRDYIYFPISRALLRRNVEPRGIIAVAVPPIATMLVSGIWHGATLNLLVWGALHGVYQTIERFWAQRGSVVAPDKQPAWQQVISVMMVFGCTTLAWLPFRMSLPTVGDFLVSLTKIGGLTGTVLWRVPLVIAPAILLDWLQYRARDDVVFLRWPRFAQAGLLATLMIVTTLLLIRGEVQPFIYQGF